MRQTKFTTQIYSLFGAGYVLEAHDPDAFNKLPPRRRGALLAVIFLALSTAAGAIAATNWNWADPELWAQEAPSSVLKLPGGFGVDDAVY